MHKPYKPKTVAQLLQDNDCRIELRKQAELYARWLHRHKRTTCYLYPEKKRRDAHPNIAGGELRWHLHGMRHSINVVEVDPKSFLCGYCEPCNI